MARGVPAYDFDRDAVGRVLQEWRGDRSWQEFAEAAGVELATLSAVAGGHRRLSKEVAVAIAGAHCSGDTARYDLGSLYEALAAACDKVAKERYRSQFRALIPPSEFVERILGRIAGYGPDVHTVVVTTERPIEFGNDDFSDQIVEAIRRNGAKFSYVFPEYPKDLESPHLLQDYMDAIGSVGLELQFRSWKHRLARRFPTHSSSTIEKNVKCCTAQYPHGFLFFSPYVKYALVRSGPEATDRQVSALLEVLHNKTMPLPRYWIELDSQATRLLDDWCTLILGEE